MDKTYEIVERDDIPVIVFSNLPVPHGSSTRHGGVSTGPFDSLNLSTSTGDNLEHVQSNRRRLGRALGMQIQPRLKMDHGIRVAVLTPQSLQEPLPEADACITDSPQLSLCVTTADCVPILFHCPQRGAVGAAHAGWRGTVDGIVKETALAMVEQFDCPLSTLQVAIGPCIGPCCFEVGSEVAQPFTQQFAEVVAPRRGGAEAKFEIDLQRANSLWLQRAGVKKDNIVFCDLCTACHRDLFFSHRRDRGLTGRMMTVIQTSETSNRA